jgi:hypothetical protein
MNIAGIEIRNSQVEKMVSRSPRKSQYRSISQSGTAREAITLDYTHRYSLTLHSLDRSEYIDLYNALLIADQTDDGQITIDITAGIRLGIVHIANNITMPSTIDFDFDITTINPEPKGEYSNLTIPLSIYVAV